MWKNKKILLLIFSLSPIHGVQAISFDKAIDLIKTHTSVTQIKHHSKALQNLANIQGSSGDPILKLAAKNFPITSLKNDQTPMTGIELNISKKVPLSTKYANTRLALLSQSKAKLFDSKNHKQILIKNLWKILIKQKRLNKERIIITQNLLWITNILKVSQKLYANGKLSQKAILDIQIRKSELEVELSNNAFIKKQTKSQLQYLLSQKAGEINSNSIPWSILNTPSLQKNKKDYREMSLKKIVKGKKNSITAAKLNYIPDLSLSLGFTKRNKTHLGGDLVSLSVSFPLPFSTTQYSKHRQSLQDASVSIKNLKDYQNKKQHKSSVLTSNINKIRNELRILNKKSINFAKSYRAITAKSYTLGRSSYLELLQSELKLQKLSLKNILLEEEKDKNIISLKYLLGEKLHD